MSEALAELQPVMQPYKVAESAAMECWQEATGDLRAAENILFQRLATDPELSDAIIFLGVREAVRNATHRTRASIARASREVEPNDDNVEGLHLLANRGVREFLDFPLPGGGRLGDADKELLGAARLVYQRNARGSHVNELWLGLIGKRLRKGKVVSDQFDQDALLRLKKKAEDEADNI